MKSLTVTKFLRFVVTSRPDKIEPWKMSPPQLYTQEATCLKPVTSVERHVYVEPSHASHFSVAIYCRASTIPLPNHATDNRGQCPSRDHFPCSRVKDPCSPSTTADVDTLEGGPCVSD